MTLIKSISGIRGTIGGGAGEGLNPLDIVKFTSAYATLIRKTCTVKSNKIVVGRDARHFRFIAQGLYRISDAAEGHSSGIKEQEKSSPYQKDK